MNWFKGVLIIVLGLIVVVNLLGLMVEGEVSINRKGMGYQVIALSLCLAGTVVFL